MISTNEMIIRSPVAKTSVILGGLGDSWAARAYHTKANGMTAARKLQTNQTVSLEANDGWLLGVFLRCLARDRLRSMIVTAKETRVTTVAVKTSEASCTGRCYANNLLFVSSAVKNSPASQPGPCGRNWGPSPGLANGVCGLM
jgi:hypothetical protein